MMKLEDMVLKVEVYSDEIVTKSGLKKNGEPFMFYKQPAYAYLPGKPHPEWCLITLDGQSPYAKGIYFLSPQSYIVNRYRDLELWRPRLVAAPTAPRASS